MKSKSIKNEMILVLLLVITGLAVRLMPTNQTDFDSFWIHGMSESIKIYGFAQWVYHPVSLFGYYPLSYPSGLMFFLALVSELTGLTMNATILVTGIFFGIFTTLMVFLIGRELGGFEVGFLVDAYSKEIILVPNSDNTAIFPTAFITLFYGSRR